MAKKDSTLNWSHVKVTCVENAPPITDWLRFKIKQWIKEKHGEDVEVELYWEDKVKATS